MTAQGNGSIRILLVEEQSLVRAALQKLLESWPNYKVVGETGSREETLKLLKQLDPDVILLTLPGDEAEGLETVSALAQAAGRARLLVLVGEGNPGLGTEIVRLGARGVVRTNTAADAQLRQAIRTVHEGREIWLDRASLSTLIAAGGQRVDRKEPTMGRLTHRESQVANLVCKGYKNKEVGERLFISETTVRHHLTAIFAKLEVRNRFELIDHLHRHRFSSSAGAARLNAGTEHLSGDKSSGSAGRLSE